MAAIRASCSRREWLLILSLAMVFEFAVFLTVFKFGADTGVVNYMSFAATIVSIILAVLAIVYSYYQNFSQQHDSNTLATQIELLKSAVNDTTLGKSELLNSLNTLNEISTKIDESIHVTHESRDQIALMVASFQKLQVPSMMDGSNRTTFFGLSPVNLTDQQIESFYKNLLDISRVMLYALYKSEQEELELIQRCTKYFGNLCEDHNSFGNITGTVMIIWTFVNLHYFGLMNGFTGRLAINPSLRSLIEEDNRSTITEPMSRSVLDRLNSMT